jgi:hypothetical protein
MATREAGRRFAEKAPIIGNVLGAAGATLSVDEAVKRYKEGDFSGFVLGTIEAALNTASMAPPTSPVGLMAKGVGTVGSLGMIPVWIAHDYFGKKGPWAESPWRVNIDAVEAVATLLPLAPITGGFFYRSRKSFWPILNGPLLIRYCRLLW